MNYGQVNSAAGHQANEYGNVAMYPGNAASVPGTAASYPSNAAGNGSVATQALHPPQPWATMPFWGLPGGQQWYPPPFPMPPFPPYWPQTSQVSREGSQEQAAPDPAPTSSSSRASSSSGETDEDLIDPYLSEDEFQDVADTAEEEEEQTTQSTSNTRMSHSQKLAFTPSQNTIKFLNSVTGKSLMNDRRRAVLANYPHPSCDAAHPPKLDEEISQIVPESIRKQDRALSRIQQFSMDAFGPLVALLGRWWLSMNAWRKGSAGGSL